LAEISKSRFGKTSEDGDLEHSLWFATQFCSHIWIRAIVAGDDG